MNTLSSVASWDMTVDRSRVTSNSLPPLLQGTSLQTIVAYLNAADKDGHITMQSDSNGRKTSRVLRNASMGGSKRLGEGNTFIAEKTSDTKDEGWVVIKRTKVSKSDTELALARRLQVAVLEQHILSYYPEISNHPNIIKYHGWDWSLMDEDRISIHIVLEYCEMGTLSDFLQNCFANDSQKWEFCAGISKGLEALHLHGIAHGDVKLDNILVTVDQKTNRLHARLSDFGNARFCESVSTDENGWLPFSSYTGTPIYAPPEVQVQLGGGIRVLPEMFPYCDIFAFGLCCFEIFFGGKRYIYATEGELFKDLLLGYQRPVKGILKTRKKPKKATNAEAVIECAKQNLLPSLSDSDGDELITKVLEDTLKMKPESRLPGGWEALRNYGRELAPDHGDELEEFESIQTPGLGVENSEVVAGRNLKAKDRQKRQLLLSMLGEDAEETDDLLELVLYGPHIDGALTQSETMCKKLLQSYERVGLGHDRRGGKSGKDSSQGRVAMSMAVASSLGTFLNQNSIQQTLFWFEKAAEAGYPSAILFGRRAFEAHGLTVPDCLQVSKNAPVFESYSDMVRIAWSQFLFENDQKPIFARLGVSADAITQDHDTYVTRAKKVLEFATKKFGNSEWLIEGKIHRIHLYCILGCLEEVKELVDTHPHCINFRMDPSGATPLLIACKYGYAKIALHLLATQQAETSGADEYGNNALHYLFAFPEGEWEGVADALIALTPDLQSPISLQRTNKLIYLEHLLLGLHGTPVEWAATSGNCRIVEYLASRVKLDRLLRHRVLIIGVYLALPDMLETGLKLDLEAYAEWLSDNQRLVRDEDGTISCHQMNLYGLIGMGTVPGIATKEMGRTLSLCTSWIAHGSHTSSQYRKCVEVLGSYRVSNNKEFVLEPMSAVQRTILSGNTRLLDILLSMKFPIVPRGEQEKSGKHRHVVSRNVLSHPVTGYLACLNRHDPADILPLFETLHKHGLLLPPAPSPTSKNRPRNENDLLLAALEMEFDSSGAGSLIFLLEYLLINGYRDIEDKDHWELALERVNSITTLRFLLDNGAKKYINERTNDHSDACYKYEHENHRCCQHQHGCANFLLDHLDGNVEIDENYEKRCKEILRAGGKPFVTGFHCHNILHTFINYRVNKGVTDSSSEDINKLILLPEIKAVVHQPDFLGATALQYAVVYGDEAMVRILLKAGADPSYFNLDPAVPEPSVLVSHHLRFPPYFVIPGDFPSMLHRCKNHTRSLPSYHKSLKNIRALLLQKGIISKPCLCVLCRIGISKVAEDNTVLYSMVDMKKGVSVHTVFPRYFHRNDLEFVTIRDAIVRGNWVGDQEFVK